MAAQNCYIAMLEMDDHLQALNIKERRVTVEPMKDLDVISLDDVPLVRLPVSAYKPTLQSTKSLPSS